MNRIIMGSLVSLALSCGLVACGDSASGSGPQDPDTSSSALASSSTVASGGNTQTCTYNSTNNTLACAEQTYKTVTIGTRDYVQTWMAENLNVGTMVQGAASTANQSNDAVIEKYCYDDKAAHCAADGGLYQWTEAMALPSTCRNTKCASLIGGGHHQGVCPMGWHIPKTAEWDALAAYLGGAGVAGKTMKLNTTGHSGWDASAYNDGNSSGFSALPAGDRGNGGGFFVRDSVAYFWEASENLASGARSRNVYYGFTDLSTFSVYKTFGYSVRCVWDNSSLPTSSSSSVAVQSSSSLASSSSGATSSSSLVSASSSSISSSSSSSSASSSSAAFPCTNGYLTYLGEAYGCKTIGSYTWMTENLRATSALGFYCADISGTSDCTTNGPLYNWAAALQVDQGYLTKFAPTVAAQGICPDGWRIPSMAEWEDLSTTLGDAAAWRVTSWSAGTNAKGFSALPSGYWEFGALEYKYLGLETYFWANDQYADISPILYHKAYSVKLTATAVTITPNYKSFGFSVRCVTDP
jgi:uncharacterized protein (TIGR02145 family)